MNRVFITGTDTDCGKTYTTCCLLEYLQSLNYSSIGVKPIASGCTVCEGNLQSPDAMALDAFNHHSLQISKWHFEPPVSPHLVSSNLPVNEIADFCLSKEFELYDYQLIEGAGGLMVPLNDSETWIDFLKIMSIPVIVVVGMKLGCLNHALLTDFVLAKQGFNSVGWVANCIDPDMLMLQENIETLSSRMNAPLIGTIPHGKGFIAETSFQALFS